MWQRLSPSRYSRPWSPLDSQMPLYFSPTIWLGLSPALHNSLANVTTQLDHWVIALQEVILLVVLMHAPALSPRLTSICSDLQRSCSRAPFCGASM
eukprot:1740628-Amphidinium_carterae.1